MFPGPVSPFPNFFEPAKSFFIPSDSPNVGKECIHVGGRVKLNSPDAAKVYHFIVRWSGLFVVLGITLPIELQQVFVGVETGFQEG